MTADARIEQLRRLKKEALLDGGPERIAARRRRGEKTARERMVELLDPGTCVELDKFVALGPEKAAAESATVLREDVVTGYGKIAGRETYVFSQDNASSAGCGDISARKITRVMDLALKNGAPLVGLYASGGADLDECAAPSGAYGEIVFRNVMASGVVPQISAVVGPCSGVAVFSPAMTDFVVMVKGTSQMSVGGPRPISAETGEKVTVEELGGAVTQSSRSGVAHLAADDEIQCLAMIRRLLSYMPQNNLEEAPRIQCDDPADRIAEELDSVVPLDLGEPYDMHEVIAHIVDLGEFFEVQVAWAQNLLAGFARLDGRPIGIVASQRSSLGGALDTNASIKAARFVRFCDAFNIPLVTFVDIPGFAPEHEEEYGTIIRDAAKLFYAFSEATVPKLTVVVGKAYGAAYEAMCSKHAGADFCLAWPSAGIAEGCSPESASPYRAAEQGDFDDVIEPQETRPRLIAALEACVSKREGRPPKKHGTMPL